MSSEDAGSAAELARAELFAKLAADLDEIVAQIVAEMRRDVPEYAAIPADRLAPGVRSDAASAVTGVGAGRSPTEQELITAASVGERRATEGVSMEALFIAFRIGGRVILDRCRAVGRDMGIDEQVLLDINHDAWEWNSRLSTAAAVGHRRAELFTIRADAQSRAALLHAVLHGTFPMSRLRAHATALGISTEQRMRAVRARAHADLPDQQLEALIVERGDAPAALVGLVDGDVAGVALRMPALPQSVVAGVGPPVTIDALGESYADASRVLEAAVAFGRQGAVCAEDLALELAFLDENVGGALEHRCFAAVDALGERAAALEPTLRAFLASGMRYEQTARELSMHPNTLRKRIDRYEELTGLDLRRMDDLVALWGALERRRARSEHG